MKRVLSLLLCISLLLSVNISGLSVNAQETARVMIENVTTVADMTDVETFGTETADYSASVALNIGGIKQHWLYVPRYVPGTPSYTVSSDNTTFGFPVMKMVYNGGYAEMLFNGRLIAGSGAGSTAVSAQKAVIEGRTYQEVSGKPTWKSIPDGTERTPSSNLKANTWYSFSITIDTVANTYVSNYVEELSEDAVSGGATPHRITDTYTYTADTVTGYRFYSGVGVGNSIYLDDFRMCYEGLPYEKAEIVSIGENNVVQANQNVLSVELSRNIPLLEKDHIIVENAESGDVIGIDSIEVPDDGTHKVKVSLSSNLASWSQYRLTIDPLAFGAGSKQVSDNGEPEEVTPLVGTFETTKPQFATRGFTFEREGDNLVAKGLVVNTSGTPRDMKFIFSSFDSNGIMKNISVTNHYDFNDETGDELEAGIAVDGAEKFNFFVIDNWTEKNPILGVNRFVDFMGENISETGASGGVLSSVGASLVVNEFDHTSKKLSISIDTKENEIIDGIVLVYKKAEVLSDDNLPEFIRSLSTAPDGTVAFDVLFEQDFAYGEYVAEFVSDKLAQPLVCYFKHYTPEEFTEARKNEILTAAKSASDETGLKKAVLGLDENDVKVNNNFDIFGSDADMSNYEIILDKNGVFTRMLALLADTADYNALVAVFEECSAAQRQYEIDNPKIMIEKQTTLVNIADKEYSLAFAGAYSTQVAPQPENEAKQCGVVFQKGERPNMNTAEVDKNIFSFPVIKYVYEYAAYPVLVQLNWPENVQSFSHLTLDKPVKVRFSGKVLYDVDGAVPSWNLKDIKSLTMSEALKKDTWYNFESVLDLSKTADNFTVTYTEIADSNPHIITSGTSVSSNKFTQYQIYTGIAANSGKTAYYDDLILEYEDIPYEKAVIKNIGSAGKVDGGQNTVSVEFSKKIPELAKEHITLKNKATNETCTADSVTNADSTGLVVNVTFASVLASWSEYELLIDPLAFGNGSVQRINSEAATPVTGISGEFETTKPPFAAKAFEFAYSSGKLNAKALVANNSGTPKNMNFIFAAFDESGRLNSLDFTQHTDFVNSDGEYLCAETNVGSSKKFNFFVIDNWTDRNHLFGANYTVDTKGMYITGEASTSCGALAGGEASVELGELDYTNKKILVSIDTKLGIPADGVIFVYKNEEVLSSANLPEYAQAVSTAVDGTLSKEILLPDSMPYGAYTVEFSSASLDSRLTKTFRYYSPDEILTNKRNAILNEAKLCSGAEGLMEVLTGLNIAGESVNDNFGVFGKDVDLKEYNKNIDKLNVFARMLPSVSNLGSYDELINLFEESAKAQRADEVAEQKLQIVADAKACTKAAALMKVILGMDDNENVINTNFEVISSNADLSVYNSLKNQAGVFNQMISGVSGISDYSDLIELFEKSAKAQKSKEKTSSGGSSGGSGGSGGGVSSSMRETSSNGTVGGVNQQGVSALTPVFSDTAGHWAADYIEALYKRGIMNGYEDGTFRSESSITRAELAKTLVETFGIASGEGTAFVDVDSSSWYFNYVASAATAGIVNGFEDGRFCPDMPVSRQDAVLMLYRAMQIGRNLPVGYTFFVDDFDISEYASGAIRTLGDLGIVGGNDKKQFLPLNSITRAEVATIICRAIDYTESH